MANRIDPLPYATPMRGESKKLTLSRALRLSVLPAIAGILIGVSMGVYGAATERYGLSEAGWIVFAAAPAWAMVARIVVWSIGG